MQAGDPSGRDWVDDVEELVRLWRGRADAAFCALDQDRRRAARLTILSICSKLIPMATAFDEVRSLVAALPCQERARLFVWMAADIADQLPGIEFDPRVCGGSARVAGTRIPV